MNGIISKEAILELQKVLTPVMSKLGKGGDYVYRAYYKQQMIQAFTNFIWVGFFAVVAWVGFKLWQSANIQQKRDRKESSYYRMSENVFWMRVFAIMFWASALLLIPMTIGNSIGRLMNPDYYLIQDLLSIVQK